MRPTNDHAQPGLAFAIGSLGLFPEIEADRIREGEAERVHRAFPGVDGRRPEEPSRRGRFDVLTPIL